MAQTRTPRTIGHTYPRRGDVYDIEMDPVVGSEIGKRRPAVVVSNDLNNEHAATVTVAPMTSRPSERAYSFEALIPKGVAGLTSDSRVKVNQVKTVDKSRLVRFRGSLPAVHMAQVERALKIHLDLK